MTRRLDRRLKTLEARMPPATNGRLKLDRLNCTEQDRLAENWGRCKAKLTDLTAEERDEVVRILNLALGNTNRPGLVCPGRVAGGNGIWWRARCERCSEKPEHCATGTPTERSFWPSEQTAHLPDKPLVAVLSFDNGRPHHEGDSE